MTRRGEIALLVLVALLTIPVVPVAGAPTKQVSGSPSISLTVGENYVRAGEQTQVRISIVNSGDILDPGPAQFAERVTRARNVRLTVLEGQIDASLDIETGPIVFGSLPRGEIQTASVTIESGEKLQPGHYRIPVRVEYDYTFMVHYQVISGTYSNVEFVDSFRSTTRYITLIVEERADFTLTASSTNDLRVGDTGQFEFTVKNTGEEAAYRASVRFASPETPLYFGKSANPQGQKRVFIPNLAPGETYNGSIKVGITDGGTGGNYPIELQVFYRTPRGIKTESEVHKAGVTVSSERQFTVSNVSSTLRVGEEGTVTATISHEGTGTVSHAVVKISTSANAVHPQRTEYAVGTLASGESVGISFPVEISNAGKAGPHQFHFTVEYQNDDGEVRTSDALPFTVDVAKERRQFAVEPVDVSLTAGNTAAVTVIVTNNGAETVSNVNAKLFVDSPLSATDDEAFAPRIAPGETVEITFQLSASPGALAKQYPISMDFQYETAEGEQRLSEMYTVPADVNEATGDGPSLVFVGGIAVLLGILGGGGYWYVRRD